MLFRLRSLRIATTVLALTTLAACSKKDTVTPTPTSSQSMAWTVDGANVTANVVTPVVSGSNILISGSTTGTPTTTVLMSLPKAAGTYQISASSVAAISYSTGGSNGQSYPGTSGTIVVSSLSANNAAGTFTFSGSNSTNTTKAITNGTFSVSF